MSCSETRSSSDTYAIKSDWEAKSPQCRCELRIKKIALSIIALLNLGALGVGCAFFVMYCPMPPQAFMVSYFIGGVLGALILLKFPTLWINKDNYYDYTDPAWFLGQAITVLLFAPLVYGKNRMDLTDYADSVEAYQITDKLCNWEFVAISKEFGTKIDHLEKYGFIDENCSIQIKKLLLKAHETLRDHDTWSKKKLTSLPSKIEDKIQEYQTEWEEIKENFLGDLPFKDNPPALPQATGLTWLKQHLST